MCVYKDVLCQINQRSSVHTLLMYIAFADRNLVGLLVELLVNFSAAV